MVGELFDSCRYSFCLPNSLSASVSDRVQSSISAFLLPTLRMRDEGQAAMREVLRIVVQAKSV